MTRPDGKTRSSEASAASPRPRVVPLAERLRNLRVAAGLTQSDLAGGRFSKEYLSQIERGNYRPSPQVVKALAQAFGLKPEQLYTMLGFMDQDGAESTPSVEQAIKLDRRLEPAQKDALIRVYRSFLGGG